MGYNGQIGNLFFRVYSDGQRECNAQGQSCQQFAANSMAISDLADPLRVIDFGDSLETTCESPVDGYRLHPTSVLSTSETTGLLFYQNISSDTSQNIDGNAVGAGIAEVSFDGGGGIDCTVYEQIWGNEDPNWGDHDIIFGTDGYIYAFGGPSSGLSISLNAANNGFNNNTIWATRVLVEDAGDPSSYEFWNGNNWVSTFSSRYPAVLYTAQGSLSYNSFYDTYVYIYPTSLPADTPGAFPLYVNATTAASPEGPWSEPVTIYQDPNWIYGPVAQPYFDPSGQTLIFDISVVSTQFYIQTVKVTFNVD